MQVRYEHHEGAREGDIAGKGVEDTNNLEAAGSDKTNLAGAYSSPAEATKKIGGWYSSWSKTLSDRSIQFSYALIAANWIVFGTTKHVLDNTFSLVSIGVAILSLGLDLFVSYVITTLLRRRFYYAEEFPKRWKDEFVESQGTACCWPSTRAIDGLASFLRFSRVALPIVAGLFFCYAIFISQP